MVYQRRNVENMKAELLGLQYSYIRNGSDTRMSLLLHLYIIRRSSVMSSVDTSPSEKSSEEKKEGRIYELMADHCEFE